MGLSDRMTIPNMMAEFGAKNAYLPPDEHVFDYLAQPLSIKKAQSVEAVIYGLRESALYPDSSATVQSTHHYDLCTIEPVVSKPHRVDNVTKVSALKGVRIQQAFIGTCTNGRIEDIEAACEVLRGKKVAAGTRLLVIPASSHVLKEATRRGLIAQLLDAGAVIGVPGCGPCMGNHMGVPAVGEATISTANRNFKGRMGTRDSEIYLASPAVVAASAVIGTISDPRELV
jgi:homoaconitase/3-isopropylmalate dehydratase large subunit